MRCESTFVDFMKKILNLATAFKKKYNERFVSTGNVDIVKYMMGLDFLTGMIAKSYKLYIRVVEMMWR